MLRSSCLVFMLVAIAAADVQTGVVRSGGRAIPGATITATCGSDRISTVTDSAGRFEIGGLPAKASCNFSVAMFGFEPIERQSVTSAAPLNFDLKLQARATLPQQPQNKPNSPLPAPAQAQSTPGPGRGGFGPGRGGQFARRNPNGQTPSGGGRGGFQNLSLIGNGEPAEDGQIEPVPGATDANAGNASEAFVLNGSLSEGVQTQPGDGLGMGGARGFGSGGFGPAGFGPGGQNTVFGEAPAGGPAGPGGGGPGGFGGGGFGGRGGGGFGGGGRGGFGGGRGGRGGRVASRNAQFGNRINRGRGRTFQGSAYYTFGNSVLNARPYSFTSPQLLNGQELPKSGYAYNRFGFSGGGPLRIPKLFSSDKTFWFVNYTGQRTKSPIDNVLTVPNAAERTGDFSGVSRVIYNPLTNAPFPGNVVPTSMMNPAATGLLNLIPMPNAPGVVNNYQLITSTPTNSDNLQVRINQTISTKDRLNVNFNFQHRNSDSVSSFGFVDPSHGYGLNSTVSYSRTFSRYLINNASFTFSRNISNQLSYFSYGQNISGQLGITGVTDSPIVYGPPTINFTNFGGLSDAAPSTTRAQTTGASDSVISMHGNHTITFGAGVQRRQNNITTYANGRGSYTFTGAVTSQIGADGLTVNGTGYDFADFLLGRPQGTSVVNYTNNAFYFRETAINSYISDDWRWKSNLSINAGLRWEYFSPFNEKYGHMANLDIAPGFTAVAPVTPGESGPYSGTYPSGLMNPDYKLFSPRIGVAWKPWKDRQIVVRAGYGIYYNGGVYSQFANRLAIQPPFVDTVSLATSVAQPLTLENGFATIPTQTILNTWAVAKNYQPGYAQSWNFSIQKTLPHSFVIEAAYQGTKGTDLDVFLAPNRATPGSAFTAQQRLPIANATAFTFDESVGNSIYNAGQLRLTRRFADHMSFNVIYTLSKSLDNTSALNGNSVVQWENNLALERGLSSFDHRHNLRLNYTLQSPVSSQRAGLGWNLLRGWTIGGNFTASSGTPYTAVVIGDTAGTGVIGTLRAQATGIPVTGGSGFFNTAAFTTPASGTYGDAGRNTIPGIPYYSLTASFFRSFRIDDKRRIEFRIDSTNPLNSVEIRGINTTVGSINYGIATNAYAMRSVTATARLRF